jgi:DeoR family ulaG and ulaABCDEF operon transcriptional repressor
MHASQRDQLILELLGESGFVAFQALNDRIQASPATLRRDLDRLEEAGRLIRVHGGARLPTAEDGAPASAAEVPKLGGIPFHQNIQRHLAAKQAIGAAAAALCRPHESIIIDGGSTTLQMCRHLEALELQVLSNSLQPARSSANRTSCCRRSTTMAWVAITRRGCSWVRHRSAATA